MADYRKLIETPCFECLVEVVGWKQFNPEHYEGKPDPGYVLLSLFSSHEGIDRTRYRGNLGRLKRAWRALRNRDGDPFLEFYDVQTVNETIAAIQEASEAAFGPDGIYAQNMVR